MINKAFQVNEALRLIFYRHFTSQVFDIWVGSEPCQFAVHEDLLVKSPKLKSLCTAAKLKSRNGKMANVIHLPKCNPVSMGYIFEYLYSDTLKIAVTNALEELKQLAELYSLCCSFQLDDLKRTVVENLESSQLSSKVPAIQFLKVIESMYQEESHSILNTYFIKVAPGLVKALEESDPSEIGKMIYEGGAFATAIFGAFREVYKSKSDIVLMEDTRKVKVKAESGIEGEPEPKRVKFQIRGPLEDLPSWADLSDADRMLARLRAQQNSWHQISATLETVTGEPHPIDKLMDRYDRITANWWNLQDGDVSLFPLSTHLSTLSPFHPTIPLTDSNPKTSKLRSTASAPPNSPWKPNSRPRNGTVSPTKWSLRVRRDTQRASCRRLLRSRK